ncbi:hypothetical protein BDA96_07G083600 [Sorghum bicolor]|uniref:Uncharacterized protein n=1 Tax=Sorghum bicolor TaxID=4558 RepID=A0A921QJX5_SORBI|nr:hypothetical protein BDA96_07G083600 [Sorghum bicolor]
MRSRRNAGFSLFLSPFVNPSAIHQSSMNLPQDSTPNRYQPHSDLAFTLPCTQSIQHLPCPIGKSSSYCTHTEGGGTAQLQLNLCPTKIFLIGDAVLFLADAVVVRHALVLAARLCSALSRSGIGALLAPPLPGAGAACLRSPSTHTGEDEETKKTTSVTVSATEFLERNGISLVC